MGILDNKKMLLTYGFSEDEISHIKSIFEGEGMPAIKVIDSTMLNMKVKDIIEGLKFPIALENIPKERVILFNNLSDNELTDGVSLIRSNINPAPILAVVTSTSLNWTFKYLLNHLIEEREWYKKNQK